MRADAHWADDIRAAIPAHFQGRSAAFPGCRSGRMFRGTKAYRDRPLARTMGPRTRPGGPMNRTLSLVASFFAALLMQGSALAEGTARLVLKGYDPVAYFTDGKPVQGNARISYEFDEGRYYFVNERHRAMFAAAPERYAPQFGGYCTGSMSRGVRYEGHPEAWIIADDKLYVFGAADSTAALQMREKAQTDRDFLASRIPNAMKSWQAMR